MCLISDMREEYKIILLISMETGLRISDVLSLTFEQAMGWKPVTERKTGKTVVLCLPPYLKACIKDRMYKAGQGSLKASGLVCPRIGHDGKEKPIARSTIYRAVRRAFEDELAHVTPHTARKIFAVELYRKTGDLKAVQEALRHDNPSTTLLYALSDVLQHFHD